MRKRSWLVLAGVFALATCAPFALLTAEGATASWTGATSTDWNTATNWSGNVFPSGAYPDGVATINTATGNIATITADSAFVPSDMVVGTGGNSGRVDHRAGMMGTGGGNWFFLGHTAGNATYNLADTAATGGLYTGYGLGSGSLNVGGATQNGNLFVGLDNGTISTVNINTSGTLAAGGVFLGANGGAMGTVNLDNGTVNVSGEFQVGAYYWNQGTATNALNVNGGTLTANIITLARGNNNAAAMTSTATITGGTLNSLRWFTLGFAGSAANTATVNNSGGTINVNTAVGGTGVLEMGVFDATTNVFNQNSGAVTLQNSASISFGQGGNHSGTSTFNQNGGTVTFYSDAGTTVGGAGLVILGNGNSTGTYAYNLNGGTLTTQAVQRYANGASGTLNFNGGTLKAAYDTSQFVYNLTAANVRNGGAIIDTNGFNVTVADALQHSAIAGDNAIDGGLTKNGAGTLALGGINTYNGNTIVAAGTLELKDNAGLLFAIGSSGVNNWMTGVGAALLDGDFTFDLSGASTTIGDSWAIVDAAALNETFGSNFTVNAFIDAGGDTWTKDINGTSFYQFSESTGVLQVVPEPATLLMLLVAVGTLPLSRRRAV